MGMERSANQDSLLTLSGIIESADSPPPFGMFIVADGMGGHTDGERASYVAATTLARHVANLVYLPMLMEQELRRMRLDFVPSAANFILVKVGDGMNIFKSLSAQGVIVRAMDEYDLPEYIRIRI